MTRPFQKALTAVLAAPTSMATSRQRSTRACVTPKARPRLHIAHRLRGPARTNRGRRGRIRPAPIAARRRGAKALRLTHSIVRALPAVQWAALAAWALTYWVGRLPRVLLGNTLCVMLNDAASLGISPMH